MDSIGGQSVSPEADRETGKELFFSPGSTPEEKRRGFSLLLQAGRQGDPESRYIIAKLLLDGRITMKNGNSDAEAVRLLCGAARSGYYPARGLLSEYCLKRYDRSFPPAAHSGQPLTGFDGERIRISRTGMLTPVDAVLEYTEGRNILTFSLNLFILDSGVTVADAGRLKAAVIRGIRMWEGHYSVFGGQDLEIRISITEEPRLFDNVIVALMGGDMLNSINKALDVVRTKRTARTKQVIRDKRSMATTGIRKWSVRSRKFIYLHSRTGLFDDYDEMSHVIKHEFGHVLGLGDLYEEAEAGLPGVPAGTYPELDSFVLKDRFYNLVMCSHYGPVSNNDIEMIVLAFSENRLQQYQPSKVMKEVSKALGRGN